MAEDGAAFREAQLMSAHSKMLHELNESRREMTRSMMLHHVLIQIQEPEVLGDLLSLAIDDKNWPAVRFLIDTAEADVNAINYAGDTRLDVAVALDQLEKTRVLIILGAKITGRCTYGGFRGDHIRLLIAHGACIPSAPWMQQHLEQVRCGRRVALTMIGIRRFKGALRHVDRFLIREIALAIVVAAIHHN